MDDWHEENPNDADLSALLRRVRPVGPPGTLRARVLSTMPEPGAWRWGVAAAALLAMAVGLPLWSARVAQSAVPPAQADRSLETLADLLGGDDRARQEASLILMVEQMRADRDAAALNHQPSVVSP